MALLIPVLVRFREEEKSQTWGLAAPIPPLGEKGPLRGRGRFVGGRNRLSGGVFAVVEGSSSDFGDLPSCSNSSNTRPGPSTAASMPALRTPPCGRFGIEDFSTLIAGSGDTGRSFRCITTRRKNEKFEDSITDYADFLDQ